MNKYVKYNMKELSDVSESVEDDFVHRLNIRELKQRRF